MLVSLYTIAFAFLFFEGFLLIRSKEVKLFDLLSNFNYGLFNRAGFAIYGLGVVLIYQLIWEHLRLESLDYFHREQPMVSFALCFIVWDLLYYWAHRVSHQTKLGRFAHRCHHEGHQFNVSLALRNGLFQQAFNQLFLLNVAFLGFAPEVFLQVSLMNIFYQFFIHSRYLPRFRLLNILFNDTYYHRLHHSYNESYQNKNYGGVLIIWDRLFGTLAEEQEIPKIGIRGKAFYDVLDSSFRLKTLLPKIPIRLMSSSILLLSTLLIFFSAFVIIIYNGLLNMQIASDLLYSRAFWVCIVMFLATINSALFFHEGRWKK
jgi:sterol desaturase/sphingolipid hydroxylase (fatty acid hydroxylase superfamily)